MSKEDSLQLVQIFEDAPISASNVAWSADGTLLAAGGGGPARVWLESGGSPIEVIRMPQESTAIAWHPSQPILAIGGNDGSIVLRDLATVEAITFCNIHNAHRNDSSVSSVAWSPDGTMLAVADDYGSLSIWDAASETLIGSSHVLSSSIIRLAWAGLGRGVIIVGRDGSMTIRETSAIHTATRESDQSAYIADIDITREGTTVALAMGNRVVHVVNTLKEKQDVILEGLLDDPQNVRFSPDAQFVAATSSNQLLLWRCQDWVPVAENPPWAGGGALEFHPTKPLLVVANPVHGQIDCYWLDYARLSADIQPDSRRYVNAKVVLLGDTGVGKSGLGLVLSGQPYRPTDSTHGRNVWIFDSHEVEKAEEGTQTREVLLWDLAGQPGYRLIHQLHLNEVAAALIVFDSRSETDPFSGVKHWVRALAQARQLEGPAAVPMKSYLVAARADRGGVAVTRERIQGMTQDFGLDGFFETSAKEGWKVADLAQAIRDGIDWDARMRCSRRSSSSCSKRRNKATCCPPRLTSSAPSGGHILTQPANLTCARASTPASDE